MDPEDTVCSTPGRRSARPRSPLSGGSRWGHTGAFLNVALSCPESFECLTLKGRAAQQWHCSRRDIWSTQLLAILGIQDGVFCSHFHFLILAKSIQSRDKPPITINQTKQNHLLLKPCYFNLHYYQEGKATGLLQILLHSCKRASGLKLYFFCPSGFPFAGGQDCTTLTAQADSSATRPVSTGKWVCNIRPTLPDAAALPTSTESAKKSVSEELCSMICEHLWVSLGRIIQPCFLHPPFN